MPLGLTIAYQREAIMSEDREYVAGAASSDEIYEMYHELYGDDGRPDDGADDDSGVWFGTDGESFKMD
jgi:hypothetical protein